MTPAARYQACITLLEKIERSSIPMDSTAGDWLRFRKYIGSKDRANIVERVYSAMRARARLGWHLARAGHEDGARARIIAFAVLSEGMTVERLNALFDGGKYAPEPLTDAERTLIQALTPPLDSPDMPDSVRVECPPRHESALRALWGPAFADEMAAMMTSATLDLRANLRQTDRDKVRASLAADGIETDPTPYSPWGLRVRGKAFLSATRAFRNGQIEIQDEGSQLVALLCAPCAGAQVLDYCAGAGGKTLALAAAMNNKGRIVAMDLEAGRLEKARGRLRRAGVADIVEVRPLNDEKQRRWLKRQKGTFDAVLTDVPCTGTGTWRRNPDMRWRDYGPGLETLLPIQAEILDRVAHTVKPGGGRLVYATCSLLPDENEKQIEAFLATHPEFSILPLAQAWESIASGIIAATASHSQTIKTEDREDADKTDDVTRTDNVPTPLSPAPPCAGPFLRLSPLRHNTDGFFAAILVRA